MGIFEIFAKLVNDYATEGKFPIDNNNLTTVTLEVMVRQLQMGLFSPGPGEYVSSLSGLDHPYWQENGYSDRSEHRIYRPIPPIH